MNILILNYEYPPLGGGAGLVTQHLAEQFNKKGHQVFIVTTWFQGTPEYSVQENITIVRLKSLRKYTYKSNPAEMLSWIRHSKKFFSTFSPKVAFDVCLANFTLPGGEVALHLKKKWELPFVILSHGHDIPWFSPKQMFWYHLGLWPYIKKILAESARNVLLTPELKASADKFLGKKFASKNTVIPNGLNIPEQGSESQSKNEKMTILFVGRLVEQKDPITLLKAIKLLEQKKIPFHLKIIGDGDLKTEMERLIFKLGIKNISLMGKVSHSEVMQEMSKSHILVAASREEAMSLSVLEGISNGLYVVATKISGNDEVIVEGQNGDFVKFGDEEEIASKIENYYFDKYLKGYSYPNHLNLMLASKYSWEVASDKYLEVFNEIKKSR